MNDTRGRALISARRITPTSDHTYVCGDLIDPDVEPNGKHPSSPRSISCDWPANISSARGRAPPLGPASDVSFTRKCRKLLGITTSEGRAGCTPHGCLAPPASAGEEERQADCQIGSGEGSVADADPPVGSSMA